MVADVQKEFKLKLEITVIETKTAKLFCDSYELRDEIGSFLKSKKFHRGSFSEPDYALVSSGNQYYVELNDKMKNLDKMISALKKKYDIQENVIRTSSKIDHYKIQKAAQEILNKWANDIDLQKALQDMYDVKNSLRKKFRAMPGDEVTINAAKQVAKQYKIRFQDILKTMKPDKNISGAKYWDSDGNLLKSR
jgi:hypothetical protein